MNNRETETVAISKFNDALENLIANLNTNSDKKTHTKLKGSKLSDEDLELLYEYDYMSANIVNIVADDMTMNFKKLVNDLEPEVTDKIVSEEDRLQLVSSFNQAVKWSRLYGTSFIYMNIDDSQQPDKPLDIDSLKEGCILNLVVIDKTMIKIDESDINYDLEKENNNFATPEYYELQSNGKKIHHSRLLRFDAVQLPIGLLKKNGYFANSVLVNTHDLLKNLMISQDIPTSMMFNNNVDTIKVKGLMNFLKTSHGTQLITKRFNLASMLRSFNNMLLLDTEEDIQTRTVNFTGMVDFIEKYANLVSAATGIPVTRLLGTSPKGLNSTGEHDEKNYKNLIATYQSKIFKPKLDNIFNPIFLKHLGLQNIEDLNYQFIPIGVENIKEKSEIDLNNAKRDEIYLENDIIPASAITKNLMENKIYSSDLGSHLEKLEEVENDDNFSNELVNETEEIMKGVGEYENYED